MSINKELLTFGHFDAYFPENLKNIGIIGAVKNVSG